jgi:hypothetical protein
VHNWRFSFIISATIWGVVVTITTELLSVFKQITFVGLAATWTGFLLLSIIILLKQKSRPTCLLAASKPLSFSAQERVAIGIIIAFILIIGIIAIIAPPSTWDSMAYHMARIAHWIQNQSVKHYSTCYLPQLYQMPWAEFAIMHFQVLSGGDIFANCVQWLSMVGSLIGVSLIASLLGANRRAQIISIVFAATIPMGILQGSSTQNDYVVTFWLVCFASFSLRWLTLNSDSFLNKKILYSLGMGGSLGLALLTKGTAYIYAAPFIFWAAFLMFKRMRVRALHYGLLVATVALIINVGHYSRNIALFDTPIYGGSGQENNTNRVHNLSAFMSNAIRNISLHIGTPFRGLNAKIDQQIRKIHDVIGISVDDSRTTSWGNFRIHRTNTDEDCAGNPVHLMLIAVGYLICLFWKKLRSQSHLMSYLLIVMATLVLFCLLLKWQPWNSRLQLPFFVLSSPVVGFALERFRQGRFASVVALGLCVSALPWLCFNETRALLPKSLVSAMREPNQNRHETIWTSSRTDQYFNNGFSRALKEPYLEAIKVLNTTEFFDIGLLLPFDPWEYQLWIIMQAKARQFRFEHVLVSNISRKLEDDNFIPSAIIRVRAENETENGELQFKQYKYLRQWSKGLLDVFVRDDLRTSTISQTEKYR